MKSRSRLAWIFALGLVASACHAFDNDNPSVQDGGGSGSDANPPMATLTSFVIDQVMNHSGDPAPVSYADFKDLPDPDGDTNNTTAYSPLFP